MKNVIRREPSLLIAALMSWLYARSPTGTFFISPFYLHSHHNLYIKFRR